jgi:subtilisin family serine protease
VHHSRLAGIRPVFRPLIAIFSLLVFTFPSAAPAKAVGADLRPVPRRAARAVDDTVIIKLKPGQTLDALHRQLGTKGRKLLRGPQGADLELVKLPPGQQKKIIEALRQSGLVEYAEPDYELNALVEPNDFRLWDGSQWNLKNTGIYGGTPGADVDAVLAWDTRTSAAGLIVAVVDTGVRLSHEDLRENIWRNPGENGLDANGNNKAGNGLDDDANGYVDDAHGINALNHSGNVNDDYGHGTHVSAIIGATANNGVGVAGIAWDVEIMPLKFLDGQGQGTIAGAIECLDYARAKGAKIVNASWGSYEFTSQALRDAITALRGAGIIFVAASGNSAGNNDANPLFPASYEFDNIISVAASNRTDNAAGYSNWGATTVDLAAPGSPVFSAWNRSDSDYVYMEGTSMAAPHVAAAAALVWAGTPTFTYQQVIAKILAETDPLPAFAGKNVTGGRLNLAKALSGSAPPPPPPPPPPTPTPPPPPPGPRTAIIWVEDAIPTGAWTSTSGGDVWNWVTASPAPYSGTKSHQSALRAGYHDHTFQQASVAMQVAAGDILFFYVYIDPANPPREIMVSWFDGSWEHRAFWGEHLISYGTYNTASLRPRGALPAAGGWVRLEVPASLVALEGRNVTAMSFTLYDGRVAWDAAGRNTVTP